MPTRSHLLRPLLEGQDAEPTAMNLAQAQQIYFLGMRLALERSESRYRGHRVDGAALVDGFMRLNAEQRLAALAAGGLHLENAVRPEPATAAPTEVAAVSSSPPPSASSDELRATTLGASLERKRVKERSWDAKTARQASRLFALFERFLAEEFEISDLSLLRQPQLAKFVNFLHFEVYMLISAEN